MTHLIWMTGLLSGLLGAGEWTNRIRNADCAKLPALVQELHRANSELHASCRGAVLNQSDRCRGVDLAEAYGEVKAKRAECRNKGVEIPGLDFYERR